MAKVWRIFPHDADRIASLQRAVGVPAVVAQLLISRGNADANSARTFLDPRLSALRPPEELPGCAEAADRLYKAVRERRQIVVFGDYDVDGMTATALLARCLRMLGGQVTTYVPHRIDEGYGLSVDSLRMLAEQGASLVVTVDCGINALAEAEAAAEAGLELIITDHHQPGAQLPRASAVVHPALPQARYPFPYLSGVGVAFKLAWAVAQKAAEGRRVSPEMRDFLMQAVGLTALGTVADVVPLLDENRILVRHGLVSLLKSPILGIAELLRAAGLSKAETLTGEHLAYELAPRLNAVGRLGQPQLGLELLLTDKPARAAELADYIHRLNESRKTIQESIRRAAVKQIKERFDAENDAAFVLADYQWHPGVIGIVAGALAEKYQRPVALISLDPARGRSGIGSARCGTAAVSLIDALAEAGSFLIRFGGHAEAAGFRIDEQQIDSFRAAFVDAVSARMAGASAAAELRIDAETPLGGVTAEVVQQIELLAPFGAGNARPVLCASRVRLAEMPKAMGKNGDHLQVRVEQDGVRMRAVAFRAADWLAELSGLDQPIDVAFEPHINTFGGGRRVELRLIDWRRCVC